MQLADSFFPSGMFGASGGLESYAKTGRVKDRAGVLSFIRQQIKLQLAPCDCVVLLAVMNAAKKGDLPSAIAADNLCSSMKLVREVRTASTRSGRQLLHCVLYAAPDRFAKKFLASIEKGRSPGTYPACLAMAAHSFRIPNRSALRMMLYSYCASVVGSAIRLGLISHLDAQKTLAELGNEIESVKVGADISELWQVTPLVDVLQMQHERDELRMFIT